VQLCSKCQCIVDIEPKVIFTWDHAGPILEDFPVTLVPVRRPLKADGDQGEGLEDEQIWWGVIPFEEFWGFDETEESIYMAIDEMIEPKLVFKSIREAIVKCALMRDCCLKITG